MREFTTRHELSFECSEDAEEYMRKMEADEERARSQPGFDFFKEYPPERPKLQISAYVASPGFNVPFVESREEWERHLDAGTAMLRSENAQDHVGWSGIFSSAVLKEERLTVRLQHSMYNSNPAFSGRLGQLIQEGLRSSDLNTRDYMIHLRGYGSWLVQAH